MGKWMNWSRELACDPVRQVRPGSTEDVAAAVKAAVEEGLRVRATGAGHSFTALVPTDGVIVDLSGCSQVRSVDQAAGLVRVQAGIRLGALAAELDRRGLAFANMGDIDTQTLAGATATGTHGTGIDLGNLSTQIHALQLVDGHGEVHEIGPDDPRLRAARVNLGALGIVTEITLQALPAYTLRGHDRTEPVDAVLDAFEQRAQAHRHFELFTFPYSDLAITRTNDVVDDPRRPDGPVRTWVADRLLTTYALGTVSRIGRRAHRAIPMLNRLVSRLAGERLRFDAPHRIFASPRDVRFTEMELAVPRAAGPVLVREIRELVARERLPINFPIELRTAAADDTYLSPAHARDSAYVAVHAFERMPFDDYLAAVWELARRHDARPHWGKRHPASHVELARMYPRWEDFQSVRAVLDPGRRFTNDHIARVLGP